MIFGEPTRSMNPTTVRHISRRSTTLLLTVGALWCAGIQVVADDWPQWLGPGRDSVWRESGILKSFPKAGLKQLWRSPIGPGYSGPAVADGQVFVLDRVLAPGATNPENLFRRGSIPGTERIHCFDQSSGKTLWIHEYDSAYTVSYPKGPRATPAVKAGRVYSLGTEGDLICLESKTGQPVWSRNFGKAYGAKTPTWGFAAHPLLDGNQVISLVGGKGSAVVAFNKTDGSELWRALTTDDVAYCPPVIYKIGGVRQLIIWLVDGVHSLDPKTGKIYWSHPWKVRGGGSIAMPRMIGHRLFLSTFFNGSLMLQLNAQPLGVEQLWISPKISTKDTTFLHALNCTPWLEGEYIYGVCNYGQFRCLQISNGKRIWESFKPLGLAKPRRNANAFIVKNGDRYFLCPDSGDLVIAKLSPDGYEEIDRTRLIEPTDRDGGSPTVWSHPAFAGRCVFARNDREIVCVSLAADAE
jgi:outer membrane protein assembly factor BamB